MYQDRRQWARAAYSIGLLLMVMWLIEPEQLIQLAKWQEARNLWWGTGFIQSVFFTIGAGLIFPKAKKLDMDLLDEVGSDAWQFVVGFYVAGVGWFIAML